MRRTLLAVVGLLVALVLSACSPSGGTAVSAGVSVPATDSRVAMVDGLAVVVGEIERELRRSRGPGSTDKALRRLVEIKVQQAMMLREGVIQTADYSSYLDGLAKENARREAALRKGEAVFGPTKLEPDYYFGYRFDAEVIALKERLQAGELRASDADLRAFYTSVKARLLNQGTETTADVLTFTRDADDASDATDAEQRANEAGRRLRAGVDAATVARSLGATVRRDTTRGGSRIDPTVALVAGLRPGEVSHVLDTGKTLVVVRVAAKKDLGFEQDRDRIHALWLDQKYRELIQRQVRQAEVDIDHDVLDRIPTQ
jgi:hypothetical protein